MTAKGPSALAKAALGAAEMKGRPPSMRRALEQGLQGAAVELLVAQHLEPGVIHAGLRGARAETGDEEPQSAGQKTLVAELGGAQTTAPAEAQGPLALTLIHGAAPAGAGGALAVAEGQHRAGARGGGGAQDRVGVGLAAPQDLKAGGVYAA
jgi:hypothetical protein